MTIEELFNLRRSTRWHINEHMDALRRYASMCDSVVEFGVQHGYSTVAFLAAEPKELHSYDIQRYGEVDEIEIIAATLKTNFVFHSQSSLDAEFDTTDLIFFDSLHTFEHLKRELELHAHKSQKFLIFHDLIGYGYFDEGEGLMPADLAYSKGTWFKGLAPAVGEYLDAHPEWKICDQYYHQSGLTVYRREL